MVEWISSNIGTIVVSLLLIAVVCLVVRGMISEKKKGRSSCGCNCGSCPMSGKCHEKAG